jgi:sec-independent protein translocase protein TatB
MFNVGGGEVLVVLLVALIFLGPHRLPDAARQVGRFMTEMRRMSNGFQNELRNALDEPLQSTPRRPTTIGGANRPLPAATATPAPTQDTPIDAEVAAAVEAAAADAAEETPPTGEADPLTS